MARIKNFEAMEKIIRSLIFPEAKFIRAANLEFVIRVRNHGWKGSYTSARKNILFLFPNAKFSFEPGWIEIETRSTLDHMGNIQEMRSYG